MNPAAAKPETRAFAIELLTDDLMRMRKHPGQLYNMHPGCHVGQGTETGIALIADAGTKCSRRNSPPRCCWKPWPGRARRSAAVSEELAAIIDAVELDEKVGVCLDTCHVWDGGYDIAGDLDGVLEVRPRHRARPFARHPPERLEEPARRPQGPPRPHRRGLHRL